MKEKEIKKGEIIIYKSAKGPEIEVKLENEMIWLTQGQVSRLFNVERSVITKHFRNIFETGELSEKSNVQKMHIPNSDKPVSFYNLDAIISVGYRVNSKSATHFRIWATKTLKEYLLNGYIINQKRLLSTENKLEDLQKAITFLQEKSRNKLLAGQEQEILRLLSNYSKTLTLLNQYDKNNLSIQRGIKGKFILTYDDVNKVITAVKNDLTVKKEASEFFGQEYGQKFRGIVGNISQTFDGKELYQSLEEKAANFLYFTIKDHPFIDGNKRIASFLFVYFLDRNQYLYKETGEKKINDNNLVTLTLLIAISDPKDKEVMIKIITNLIK